MRFIDTHIHITDFAKDKQISLIKDLKNTFAKIVCVSSKTSDWPNVAKLATENPDFIIPAFGLHPWYMNEAADNWENELEKYLKVFPNAWVGECGLDTLKADNIEKQIKVFVTQLKMASLYKRPLNVHLLRAEKQMQSVLKNFPTRIMFHSFSENVPFMQQILSQGGYISLSKSVLKRKFFLEIIQNIPLNRLLSESDAPFMSSPFDIPDLLKEVAKIKRIDINDLTSIINQNFEELCNVG